MARPLTDDTGLGELDSNTICQELSKSAGRKRKPHSTYIEEDSLMITKQAKDYGISQATTFFKKKYSTINESTVWIFILKYDQKVKVAKACDRSPDKNWKI